MYLRIYICTYSQLLSYLTMYVVKLHAYTYVVSYVHTYNHASKKGIMYIGIYKIYIHKLHSVWGSEMLPYYNLSYFNTS